MARLCADGNDCKCMPATVKQSSAALEGDAWRCRNGTPRRILTFCMLNDWRASWLSGSQTLRLGAYLRVFQLQYPHKVARPGLPGFSWCGKPLDRALCAIERIISLFHSLSPPCSCLVRRPMGWRVYRSGTQDTNVGRYPRWQVLGFRRYSCAWSGGVRHQ